MALCKNVTFVTQGDISVLVEDAYCKVVNVSGNKNIINGIFSCYKKDITIPFYSTNFTYIPDLDGDNFIKQAYEYLKTLPEYADAIDC